LQASAAVDTIQETLVKLQPAQLGACIRIPQYVVLARSENGVVRTIGAVLFSDSECSAELRIFKVGSDGALKPLAAYDRSDAHSVALRDVTGDGKPEILLTLWPGNRSAAVVILRWDGKKLIELGDTSDQAEFIDLNGDGIPEIVERTLGSTNSCGEKPVRVFVQQLRDGTFEEIGSPRLAHFFRYEKKTDRPERFVEEWPLPDTFSLHSRVRVFNGTRDTHRATGISIRLHKFSDIKGTTAGTSIPLRLTTDGRNSEARVRLPSRCVRAWITVRGPAGAVVTGLLEADVVPSGDR
jgi:hypothetical protein